MRLHQGWALGLMTTMRRSKWTSSPECPHQGESIVLQHMSGMTNVHVDQSTSLRKDVLLHLSGWGALCTDGNTASSISMIGLAKPRRPISSMTPAPKSGRSSQSRPTTSLTSSVKSEDQHALHEARRRKPEAALARRCTKLHRATTNEYFGTYWPSAQSMMRTDRRIEWRHCGIAQEHDRVCRLHTDIG